MNNRIGLNELIEQITEELLIPRKVEKVDEIYPMLFIDNIEIEVAVKIAKNTGGSGNLSISIVEFGANAEHSQEQSHTITLKLSPLLTKDEMRAFLQSSDRTWNKIQSTSRRGILKSDSDNE